MTKLIETEIEYEAALERIDRLFNAAPGTDEANALKLLVLLVREYESEYHPIPSPDPIEAIKIRQEELGLKDKELVPFIGNKSIVSRILKRERDLTITMARKLHKGLGIPAEVLLAEPLPA